MQPGTRSGAPEPQLPVITVDAERYLVLAVDNRAVTVTDRGQDGMTYTIPPTTPSMR